MGALGALLTALITALSTASGVGLHIGAALCCAFLALMAGGILCFLRRYVTTASPVAAARAADRKARRALHAGAAFMSAVRSSLDPQALRHMEQILLIHSAVEAEVQAAVRQARVASTAPGGREMVQTR